MGRGRFKKVLFILTFFLVFLFSPRLFGSGEGGIVLYDRVSVTFFNDGRRIWKEERAIKILTMKGVKEKGEVVIPFSTKHQKLKVLYAYTKLPGGKVLKPSKEAYNIVSPPFESEAPIYSDLKYQTISMPGVIPGATIYYGFVLETVKPYMKGEFWAENYFQERYPVKEASLVVRVPRGRRVKIKPYHMKAGPKVRTEGNHTVYVWKVRDVPPIEDEPHMPPMEELAKKVVVTSLSSWDQVARWYHSLAKPALMPCGPLRSMAKKLTKDAKGREEAIRRIYNFVSKSIRYVGLEFGINGYRPHKACEVLKNRYGDCKDHATLLISMLRAIGIEAYPVLIPTRDTANLDPDVPRPTAFNHEIAAVPSDGGFIFLDTTSEVTPFGDLPPDDQGRTVLIVKDGKAVLSKTPVFPPDRNVEGYRGDFSLDGSGNLHGSMTFFYRGVYASMERYLFMTSTSRDIARHVEGLAGSISPGFKVEEFQISPYRNPDTDEISIKIRGNVRLYATSTAHFLILHPPVPGYTRLASMVAPEKRRYAYVVGYRMSKKIKVRIRVPDGYKVFLLPEKYSYTNRVGSILIAWKNLGSSVEMNAFLVLRKSFVPPRLYDELRELFNLTVKTLRNQVIILKKPSPRRSAMHWRKASPALFSFLYRPPFLLPQFSQGHQVL